jgi:hypothetical protein
MDLAPLSESATKLDIHFNMAVIAPSMARSITSTSKYVAGAYPAGRLRIYSKKKVYSLRLVPATDGVQGCFPLNSTKRCVA